MNIVEHELHHGASQYLLMDFTKFGLARRRSCSLMYRYRSASRPPKNLVSMPSTPLRAKGHLARSCGTFAAQPMGFGMASVPARAFPHAAPRRSCGPGLRRCYHCRITFGFRPSISQSDYSSRRATRIRLWFSRRACCCGSARFTYAFLATLRPRADGVLYVALSFSLWLALSPPVIAFVAVGSWDASLPLWSRDAVALGLPDRKLLYAGIAYIPIHAGALTHPFFSRCGRAAGFGCGAGEEGARTFNFRNLMAALVLNGTGKGPRGGSMDHAGESMDCAPRARAWRRTSTSCSRRIRSRMLVGMAAARLLKPPLPPALVRVGTSRSCRGVGEKVSAPRARPCAPAPRRSRTHRGHASRPEGDLADERRCPSLVKSPRRSARALPAVARVREVDATAAVVPCREGGFAL